MEESKKGKIEVNFDFTIKKNYEEDEFWEFISYAIEQFAVPQDVKRLQNTFQQKKMSQYTC